MGKGLLMAHMNIFPQDATSGIVEGIKQDVGLDEMRRYAGRIDVPGFEPNENGDDVSTLIRWFMGGVVWALENVVIDDETYEIGILHDVPTGEGEQWQQS